MVLFVRVDLTLTRVKWQLIIFLKLRRDRAGSVKYRNEMRFSESSNGLARKSEASFGLARQL